MPSIFKRKGDSKWKAAWWDFTEGGWKRREHCTGTTEKRLAERIAQKWEDKALAYSQGLGDLRAESIAQQEARPLEDHLRDFLAYLSSKGTGDKQVASVEGRVRRIIAHAKATRIVDLAPSMVLGALQHFRIPTEERPGLSLQSATHYIRAIKSFSRWLVRDKRSSSDALAHLQGFNSATDRRRVRRDLEPEELTRMIEAAERAPTVAVPKAERDEEKNRRVVTTRMTCPERAWAYRIAAGTGFRAAEVSSLTPESFDLDADTPTVAVEAAYSKRKRRDVQPIREDLAALLRPWLQGKPKGELVCPLPEGKAALLIRADLDAARAAWVGEASTPSEREARAKSDFLRHTDAAGRVVDFHGLRVHYISRVVNAGANVKQAMELARHSDPKLTMKTYAKVRLHDLGSVLEGMQEAKPSPVEQRAKATGTYGAPADQCPRPGPQSTDGSGPVGAIGCDEGGRAGPEHCMPNPLQLAGLGESGQVGAAQSETRPGRLELPTCGLGNRRSIQLSYERTPNSRVPPVPRPCLHGRAPLHRSFRPISSPSASTCPFMAASSSWRVAPGLSFSSVSRA
jgi:integrase